MLSSALSETLWALPLYVWATAIQRSKRARRAFRFVCFAGSSKDERGKEVVVSEGQGLGDWPFGRHDCRSNNPPLRVLVFGRTV